MKGDNQPGIDFWAEITFDDAGLIPAVVQERGSGRVLMVAYMNRHSLEETLKTGETHFWSRSRNALWRKGETSGHTQRVASLRVDCDGDTLLIAVDQEGPACHTGEVSCFFRRAENGAWVRDGGAAGSDVLTRISAVIEDRRAHPREGSYVSSLFAGGIDAILKKIGEEAGEVLIASKNGARDQIIWETADLWFHTLVALSHHGISPRAVFDELERRFGGPGRPTKDNR